MKYLVLFCAYCSISSHISGQPSDEILEGNIKLLFYNEFQGDILDECELEAFCQQALQIERIESRGFKNLVFYSIPYQPLTNCPYEDGWSRLPVPLTGSPCGYIIAYHMPGNRIYKISGFRNDDIKYILQNRDTFFSDGYRKKKKRIYTTVWLEGCDTSLIFKVARD